jgi:putative thiamine transport system permease protein
VLRLLFGLPLLLALLLPLVASLIEVSPVFGDGVAMLAFLHHPQFGGALLLSLSTGTAATLLSLVFAILIVMSGGGRSGAQAGVLLAVPHLAFAIGLSFLVAPTGLLARLLALGLGWTMPPDWVTVQDPRGLALTAALVLKETPFLVWTLAALLARDDLRQMFDGQAKVARSLGHGQISLWLNVVLPQVLPRIGWPLAAVFVYGCTVVDMAQVIGPTQPPTLAQVIWTDLNSGQTDDNARGAAGVLVLSVIIIFQLWVVWWLLARKWPFPYRIFGRTPCTGSVPRPLYGLLWGTMMGLYSLIGGFMFLASFAALWPYPRLAPQVWNLSAWATLAASPGPFLTSLVLALATSALAVAACLAWFESQPPAADRLALAACAAILCVPGLLIGLGQYRLLLATGLTATATGMLLAHLLPVTAYVFVMLHGAYRGFDPRWQATSRGLRASRWRMLTTVKWPMLKPVLYSAAVVGFAVSMAQYVPAQLIGAGRYVTLPMEAVNLSAGGSRAVLAVYALALTILPLVAFSLAAVLSRHRFRHA